MLTKMKRNGLILGAFALAATSLLIATQFLTADRIAAQQRSDLLRTLNELVPATQYTNDFYADCTEVIEPDALGSTQPQQVYRARRNGEAVALALRTTAPDGYSGNIQLLVAVAPSGRVKGVRVLSHRETPGLGDKIELRRDSWILSFNDEQVRSSNDPRWRVRRDGGAFDQFTGATITPRAVINAVQRTVLYATENRDALFNAPIQCVSGGAS
ncbi:MAG: electron transport complex subunit RsxG [Idiomarina sp.]|nr:electron transport complex subunit RsxG [Idiomarina sp.]